MENISPSDIEKTRRLLQNNGYLSGRLINFSSVKSIRKLIYLGFQTNLTLARFRCFKGYFSIISVGDSTMKTPFYRHLAKPLLFFSCSTRARPIRAQEKLLERALNCEIFPSKCIVAYRYSIIRELWKSRKSRNHDEEIRQLYHSAKRQNIS